MAPTLGGFVRMVRNHPKKIAAAVGVGYLIYDAGMTRWNRMLHRETFCEAARDYGQMSLDPNQEPRRMWVVLHPRAGDGENRTFFDKEVAPIFHLAGVDFDVRRIKQTEDVRTIVYNQDLARYDDVVVVGGDGFLQEAVTGLKQRPDAATVSTKPVGLVPVGTSNNLFRQLTATDSSDRTILAHEAALGIVEGRTTTVPGMVVAFDDTEMPSYILSHMGWGMFGQAARRGQIRRWPNQSRYDVAALVGLIWDFSEARDCQAVLTGERADGSQMEVTTRFSSVIATCSDFWCCGSRRLLPEGTSAQQGMTLMYSGSEASLLDMIRGVFRMRQGGAWQEDAAVVTTTPMKSIRLVPEMPPAPEAEPAPVSSEASSGEEAETAVAEPMPLSHAVNYSLDGTNYLSRPVTLHYVPDLLRVYTPSRLLQPRPWN